MSHVLLLAVGYGCKPFIRAVVTEQNLGMARCNMPTEYRGKFIEALFQMVLMFYIIATFPVVSIHNIFSWEKTKTMLLMQLLKVGLRNLSVKHTALAGIRYQEIICT